MAMLLSMAIVIVNETDYLAKFSLSADYYPFLRAEFVAMRLAKLAEITVAEVTLKAMYDRDILLVKRFDREHADGKTTRKLMLSGLTLLALDEMEARYASYLALG
jgi:serine/threonine-protein kinase HipA